jgi:Fe-S-cluster containining protein
MEQQDNNKTSTITCKRCGKCCLAVYIPVTGEDMERWKSEGKEEIVRAMEHSKATWARGYYCIFGRRENAVYLSLSQMGREALFLHDLRRQAKNMQGI